MATETEKTFGETTVKFVSEERDTDGKLIMTFLTETGGVSRNANIKMGMIGSFNALQDETKVSLLQEAAVRGRMRL